MIRITKLEEKLCVKESSILNSYKSHPKVTSISPINWKVLENDDIINTGF